MPCCDRVLVVAVAGTRPLERAGYLLRVKMKSPAKKRTLTPQTIAACITLW
jgi:hypothetical protein